MCNFLLVNIYEIYITIIYVTKTWYDLLVLVLYMTPYTQFLAPPLVQVVLYRLFPR